ncbi:MAG: NAD(P)-dependent alcohol dehydrogenase [Acidobacteriaceae bacterium]|jgi:NADPH:quinone reductase-like Zn-dependent oxidoreductase
MQAIVYRRYGSPDVLRCEEIEKPKPRDNEVLIKVRAASVNPLDWHFMRGTPYLLRIGIGLRTPRSPQLGVDVAGQVEEVGSNVTRFKPGDDVFGACRGAFAEYARAPESKLVAKPSSVTFEQGASVVIAGLSALQALRDKGRLQHGQKILINGAAGGVGTFAVQIAKSFGADVTGVCSTRNLDMVRSLGAHCVIDYTQQDFTTLAQRYDLLLDCIGNHSLSACRRVLVPKGTFVGVGGSTDTWGFVPLAGMFATLALAPFISQKIRGFLAKLNQSDLAVISELMQSGKVTPVIDRRYKLTDVPDAIRYLEEGHARGKVVITVDH